MARREGTTVDSIISIALSTQVTATAWKVRDTFEQRAARWNRPVGSPFL